MGKRKTGQKYYAVHKGNTTGVFKNWDDCSDAVKGYPGARYKSFPTLGEAEAFAATGSEAAGPTVLSVEPILSPSTSSTAQSVTHSNDANGFVEVYCDGSCRGNGKADSVAGIGVFWGNGDHRNLAERCPGRQTNNRAELTAIIRILEQSEDEEYNILVKTDSQYSINCITKWLSKWQSNGFIAGSGKAVENVELIRYLAVLLERYTAFGRKVKFEHVYGHQGTHGNEMADSLANQGAVLPQKADRDWETLIELVERQIQELQDLADAMDDGSDIEIW
ncbi:hypothetical protein CYLTODRAFT_428516 [Cylindrobasidium torrendii FP15055 ss-10]|uniref:Ribonuclease H n=1 Tax=Cylindrobasidium torrendii FP15055 ss-10 TaxID=1314674 RepID=A0A0D7BTC9_9AGAR|nr:hypothetical protein CYLTODRAFT_428516 [Cylindrobasidium torrendii FP15055 ss-10]